MKTTEIETTGTIQKGRCDLNKQNCTAVDQGEITKIYDNKREIFVCNSCLTTKLSNQQWTIKEIK